MHFDVRNAYRVRLDEPKETLCPFMKCVSPVIAKSGEHLIFLYFVFCFSIVMKPLESIEQASNSIFSFHKDFDV
jgi:hypothetical protein